MSGLVGLSGVGILIRIWVGIEKLGVKYLRYLCYLRTQIYLNFFAIPSSALGCQTAFPLS